MASCDRYKYPAVGDEVSRLPAGQSRRRAVASVGRAADLVDAHRSGLGADRIVQRVSRER